MEPTNAIETPSAPLMASALPDWLPPITTGPLADLVDEFSGKVRQRLGDLLGCADDRAMAAALGDLDNATRRIEAAAVAVARDVNDRGLYALDGHRNVGGWVGASVRLPDVEARRRAQTARLFVELPEVEALLANGRIGVAQVRELARALARPRTGEQVPASAAYLIDSALNDDFDIFRTKVHAWESLADAESTHHDHDESHRARDFRLDQRGATTYLSGRLGSAQAAVLTEILDAFSTAEYLADCEDAKRRGLVGDTGFARTAAQRRMDALFNIFCAAATAPVDGKPLDVCVEIVIDQATFEEQLADLIDPLHRHRSGQSQPEAPPPGCGFEPPPFDALKRPEPSDVHRRRRCHNRKGLPIDPRDAVIAALLGHVRRVVVGSDGVIVDLGRRSRLFTGGARDAAILQALMDRLGRCIWPGCGRTHCQIDHTIEWSDDGPSDVANSDPACGYHNRLKSLGYRARRDDYGHWHMYRPDGTEILAA